MTFHKIHFFRYTANNGFLHYFSSVLLEHLLLRLSESRKNSRKLHSPHYRCHLEFATQYVRHAWHVCCSANLTKHTPNTPFVLVNLHVIYTNGCLFFLFFSMSRYRLFSTCIFAFLYKLHWTIKCQIILILVWGSRSLSHLFPSSGKILLGASMLVLLQTCLTDITTVILSIFFLAMHYAVSLHGMA